MRKISLLFISIFMLASPAKANPLIADLSTYTIAIDAGFSGLRLFVFGARNEIGDVVAIIRGPEKKYTVRKKERVGGVWINNKYMEFENVPDFYALASSKPLAQIEAGPLFRQLNIGIDQLLELPDDIFAQARYPEFAEAFIARKQENTLYKTNNEISFMGTTLFKTVIVFPATLPKGEYTAEIYLISDGKLAGMQVMPISVEKTGFDAWIYNAAHDFPILYGLAAIAIALSAGWLAGRIFEWI